MDTYVDDGYSGTNFQRPGVQRLIADAKAGRINVILVKDLSRFGRNYIEFGQYTDYLFPSIGCRFIALNNGIDTMSNDGSTDVMCFLNLFNEFYSRDTSKKVKAVKKACAENGKYMGTYPPIGYKRDPLDKHHFIIDEETAPLVRRIFAMRASGMAFRKIATTLNAEGVQPPGELYYQRQGRTDPRRVNHLWNESTVKVMIRKCNLVSFCPCADPLQPSGGWWRRGFGRSCPWMPCTRIAARHTPAKRREIRSAIQSVPG